ncbi:MAG: hypothetical protein US25_C0038G0005 [Candidatus Moranbacteria bacterium GW2011_GWE1_36_7]|nr:MAG: hypothetical protein US16_C0048G0004 [Candidatus Moranbacteria bacterium GW2011_GWE2_36_40]KKQ13552.1 MAG: hypothetical protein US25_C0038G0005 [Candidatus Moranbacteria bacterium GW2011_GWE1_36_7]KKQ46716.1 MAG: hypothetical protein US66_C0030G0004 [Candidatus Moranbacteria bacterium GW2011_GWD2_37_9]
MKIKENKKNKENKNVIKSSIEKFLNSDSKKVTAAKFLLMTLALGGIVFAGALAPGLAMMMDDPRKKRRYPKRKTQQVFSMLKHRKLIKVIKEKDGSVRVELTNKGKKRVREFCFDSLVIEKAKKWDGKWRILMFDIPTKPKIYNNARNALRDKIKELGFVQMQKSVWVYPYECEDEILFLAETYSVEKFIDMLVAERVMHEEKFKKKFKL